MRPIVTVHGIGSAVSSGYSNRLRNLVFQDAKDEAELWYEAEWEDLCEPFDRAMRKIVGELVNSLPAFKDKNAYTDCTGGLAPLLATGLPLCNAFLRKAGKDKVQTTLANALDALLDLPLYLGELGPAIRGRVVEKIYEAVGKSGAEDGIVLVGHSLGSLIAYDAIRQYPRLPIYTLVTAGSPLGWLSELFPRPGKDTPCPQWFNFYYRDDPVCLGKPLPAKMLGNVKNFKLPHPAEPHREIVHCCYWEDRRMAEVIRMLV